MVYNETEKKKKQGICADFNKKRRIWEFLYCNWLLILV